MRRPARRAHGREPSRRRFSIGSAPAATGSAPSSNGLVTDPEGRRGRVRSGITFPKYPPDDLSPEQLMTPEPSVTEGFRAFEAARVLLLRDHQDQLDVDVVALARRLQLARVDHSQSGHVRA